LRGEDLRMSSKIIVVWGKDNSGKTTFAVNLACALSNRDCLVGLISSNLIYGDLQTFFGQSVPPEKGLFQGLNDDNPNIGEKFSEYEKSKNLFFLSVPNHYTGLLCDNVTLNNVERLISAASFVFDALIIDGSEDVTNPISSTGVWMAERIYTLYKPSIASAMWLRGVDDFLRELHIKDKQINIMRSPNGDFCDKTFKNLTELSFKYELPFVKQASELENAGTPIYLCNDRACRRYSKVLEQIAEDICGGGVK
jgi:MinD-like ATPase involved in chromosome partitioning or flagellar assembly